MTRSTSFSAWFSRFQGFTGVVAFLLLCGCGAAGVTRGADLYAQGDYVGAAELLEHEEAKLPSASLSDRARYGLYRAAALQNLGDSARAQTWLSYTLSVVQSRPSVLSADEHVLLERTLASRAGHVVRTGHESEASASIAAR